MEGARVARRDDLERLTELARLAVSEAASRRGGAALVGRWLETGDKAVGSALVTALETAMDDPGTGVWAGTIDAAAVGAAVARGAPGAPGRLPLFFVEPSARGVGVGEALLDRAVGWLAERGCTGLDVSVLPGDRATKQFFEGASMVARLIVMHRAL